MVPPLSPSTQARFRRVALDLRRIFADRFVALVAYGPHRSVAFARRVEPADLEAMSSLVETWHRDHVATPLVMTPDELHRSVDAFALELQAMVDHHVVIDGDDPLLDVRISVADLRRACAVQAKSHLVHLRQGWLDTRGHATELAELAGRSAGPFHNLLFQVARLLGEPADTMEALVGFAQRTIELPPEIGRDLLSVDEHPDASARLAGRLGEYLAATERLWTLVDGWTTR